MLVSRLRHPHTCAGASPVLYRQRREFYCGSGKTGCGFSVATRGESGKNNFQQAVIKVRIIANSSNSSGMDGKRSPSLWKEKGMQGMSSKQRHHELCRTCDLRNIPPKSGLWLLCFEFRICFEFRSATCACNFSMPPQPSCRH